MLMYSFIAVVLMASFFNSGDAAVPTFDLPASGDASVDMDENEASGSTVATIATSGGAGTVTYALNANDFPFVLDSSSGVLTNNALIDFEGTVQEYKLIIVATDSTGGDTASATLTVSIKNVNEAPTFAESSYAVCAEDGSAAGTTLQTLTSTDPDSGTSLTYTISSGDTNSDYTISSNYLKAAKVLGTTSSATLVIQVSDTSLTDTANFVVTVQSSCSGASALAVSLITLLMGLVYALN